MKIILIALVLVLLGQGMDLPVTPIKYGDPEEEKATIEPNDDDGEDPRDTPPPVFYGEEIDAETDRIIYVVDISCSMSWPSGDFLNSDGSINTGTRLDKAKVELQKSIHSLPNTFSFNIVSYHCGTVHLWYRMRAATLRNKQIASAWVSNLKADGGTGTGPAVAVALQFRTKTVILLTDGAPSCGTEDHRVMIRNANRQGAVINVFGIDAIGSYRAFCLGVASDSGGKYIDVY